MIVGAIVCRSMKVDGIGKVEIGARGNLVSLTVLIDCRVVVECRCL